MNPPVPVSPHLSTATRVVSGEELVIDRRARRVYRQGQPLTVGVRAFELLSALIDADGRVLSAEELRRQVWEDKSVGDNNLRVQLTLLRRVLGADAIVHHRGRGYQLVLSTRAQEDAAELAAEALSVAPKDDLPESPWPLVGRDRCLAEVSARLLQHQRVTLLGPPGVGKSGLALAAARAAAGDAGRPVWWIHLAPLRDGLQLASAIRSVLQLDISGPLSLERVGSALGDREGLLVLDACEHLLSLVTAFCDRLLRVAPHVRVLATTRKSLRSAGEQVLVVPPLELPAEAPDTPLGAVRASSACQLFEMRVRSADPRFRLTPVNAPVVAEICRRLDGNPLALVLAASRVPSVGLLDLRDSLDQRLTWVRPAVDDDERHQSLHAALASSHALLRAAEQRLLWVVSVFDGPFGLDDARAVAHADPALDRVSLVDAMATLVEHGLVEVDGDSLLGADAARARYTLHESVRLFARDLLQGSGRLDDVLRAHGHHLLTQLKDRQATDRPALAQPDAVRRQHASVQRVIAWASAADPLLALRLCALCATPWRRMGLHALARQLARPLLALPVEPAQVSARIELLLALCAVDAELEDAAAVLADATEALALLDGRPDTWQRAQALGWRAQAWVLDGRLGLACEGLAEAVPLWRETGDERGLSQALQQQGGALLMAGRSEEARAALQEAQMLCRAARERSLGEDDWGLMQIHEQLGELELGAGQVSLAAEHLERAALLARRAPNHFRLARTLALLGHVYLRLGEREQSAVCVAEGIDIALRQGFARLLADNASVLSGVLMAANQPVRALAASRYAERQRERLGMLCPPVMQDLMDVVALQVVTAIPARQRRAAEAQAELVTLEELRDWAGDVAGLPPGGPLAH
ncbi:winged helix-turn-helix domain-containing protein [Ideonella sp. 4Y16]|uniref:ATP-binding protein n=1 Tax=Ideonella alba TaxID=2824118 RepID=UPI001B3862D4|nr:winged helix-turn-helix domain-containing protein [Ideonella alba]MBQ0944988.1 winged helix-turn-helix domain-containing protein [Ideonella alba]